MSAKPHIAPAKPRSKKRNENGLAKRGLTSAQRVIFLPSGANVGLEKCPCDGERYWGLGGGQIRGTHLLAAEPHYRPSAPVGAWDGAGIG